MPTATHGGIGHMLSLNASSLPFKVMLRDSRGAKTDMQPESLKSFVAYSTTRTARSVREQERDEQLAQGKPFNPSIRSFCPFVSHSLRRCSKH